MHHTQSLPFYQIYHPLKKGEEGRRKRSLLIACGGGEGRTKQEGSEVRTHGESARARRSTRAAGARRRREAR